MSNNIRTFMTPDPRLRKHATTPSDCSARGIHQQQISCIAIWCVSISCSEISRTRRNCPSSVRRAACNPCAPQHLWRSFQACTRERAVVSMWKIELCASNNYSSPVALRILGASFSFMVCFRLSTFFCYTFLFSLVMPSFPSLGAEILFCV